ncbi:sugar ABC transporter substrate-binding protein [Microbacterium sp. 18062]|uniref:sugar ABC transporter substrate-binding protein n=1 Tax=Microbacterium sp. 18062 TaxID=2681410 RepID=UPI001359CEEF|nr:sugar ABC transporter substrate-binding protein [Microbacterium sp. 18062]
MAQHRRRGWVANGLAAFAISSIVLTGCSGGGGTDAGATTASTQAEGALRIGFSPLNLSAPALTGLAAGLEALAGERGHEVLVADPDNDAATQAQQVTSWIENGQVDAVWAMALNPAALVPVFEKAQERGVVVLALGTPEDYGFAGVQPGITFSTIDYETYGADLATATAACIDERLDGEGRVIFLQDPPGQSGSQQINDAFSATLAEKASDAEIVSTLDNGLERLASQTTTLSAIQGNPGANVFVGQNDEASLGALGAVQQAGLDPQSVCITGAGGNDEVLGEVESGNLFGVVALQFSQDIVNSVDQIEKMAADPTADGIQKYVPVATITVND